jgi:hypothetical protein
MKFILFNLEFVLSQQIKPNLIMKTVQYPRFTATILVAIFAFSLSNCSVGVGTRSNRTTTKSKPLPPGQAKKIYGGKSAKRYAPGQNK